MGARGTGRARDREDYESIIFGIIYSGKFIIKTFCDIQEGDTR
jgi:hypothetical protein